VHNLGEIWCATLMTLARRIGTWEAAQVVVDALKLTPANPSFLAARDAIVLAADRYSAARGDDDSERAAFVHTVWEVFARYGMGPNARTGGAEVLTGIVSDFTAPPLPQPEPEPEPEPEPGETVTDSVSPGLAIPDNTVQGISSPIRLPDAGIVQTLAVTVDISHTYRGDLEVSLIAPDGRRVALHQRSGGSADDVRQTWRSETHPGLASLAGLPTQGDWTLSVTDRAPRDLGTLNSWSIEATVSTARTVVEVESVPGLLIPDNVRTGITSELTIADSGTISSLDLDVDITHTYIGDLEVALTGPTGVRVVVHGRGGGSADNLVTSYESVDGGPLMPFVGTSLAGTWRLQVSDQAGLDVGKLNRWGLTARV
jgi:subtilisin-like proprotein convertase family protein